MNAPLAIMNLVVIGLTILFSYMGFTNPVFLTRYYFYTRAILVDKQYYRLITSAFFHADWVHLLFNMFSLYSFGSALEIYFGQGAFLSIYSAGIVGGGLFALLLHRHDDYRALGASGGVCGVIFATIFLLPGGSVQVFPIPIPIPAYIYAVGFMLFSYYGVRKQKGNIGHDAHLGGAIIGLLTATVLYPKIISNNPVLYPVVMAIAVLLLVLICVRPIRLIKSLRAKRNRPKDDELFTFKRYE
jgi:membrane associated rhomboid family serine protease